LPHDAHTEQQRRHVVDLLIEERAPFLLHQPATAWLMRRLFYPVLRYAEARETVDRIQGLSGPAIMDLGVQELALRVGTLGLDRLPRQGRVMIVANHPTGLADGVAVWQALTAVRRDVVMLANGDAIRIAPSLRDVFIPVEWGKAKRSQAGSRRLLVDLAEAFREERAVVIFPSGRIAYLGWRGLVERPWLATAVPLARRFEAPILPLHIRARNSALFYALSQVSNELRDVTLFNELLNKRGQRYALTLGLPIAPDDLPEDPQAAIEALQRHVEHELPRASRQQPRIEATVRRGPLARLGV
jgi:putative hemolysin